MFYVLFCKECKQTVKSLVYYIYVVVFVLFITSQMSSEGSLKLQEPQPGQSYYGEAVTKDQTLIMEKTLANLMQDISRNLFATYPLGFYKGVALTAPEKEQAQEILERCTGKSLEMLEAERNRYFGQYGQPTPKDAATPLPDYKVPVREGLSYGEFEASMKEICSLVGKGSSYEKSSYENKTYVPMTYEQAKAEFDALCHQDRITNAFMRLFCDYAGIILAVLPIFVGVSRMLRDRRAKAQQVLFSKPAPAAAIILSRYLANLAMLFFPVILTAFLLQQPYLYKAQTLGVRGDALAFFKVCCLWLLPEIMTVLALSFLLTELTDTILAVFVQVAWGIGSLFGAETLVGSFGLHLVTRWNTLGQSTLYAALEKDLWRNKSYYVLLAVLCVALTVAVYDKKRGRGGSILWKNMQN